jgi:hypothetical protein
VRDTLCFLLLAASVLTGVGFFFDGAQARDSLQLMVGSIVVRFSCTANPSELKNSATEKHRSALNIERGAVRKNEGQMSYSCIVQSGEASYIGEKEIIYLQNIIV